MPIFTSKSLPGSGGARLQRLAAACLAVALFGPAPAWAESPTQLGQPLKGEPGRHRVGLIDIDREQSVFRVPARILDLGGSDSPLEYLAVTQGGAKAYESLLELQASAQEFNLACILIGLERRDSVGKTLKDRFDAAPVEGDRVGLTVSWILEGREVERPVLDLIALKDDTPIPDEWVYTGSVFYGPGQYAAALAGTAIGLMHDPASIIEHRQGVGIGNYGLAGINPEVRPPPGTLVTLIVRRLKES